MQAISVQIYRAIMSYVEIGTVKVSVSLSV